MFVPIVVRPIVLNGLRGFAEPNSATSARMLREPNSGMARSAAVYKRSDSSDVVGIVSHPLQGITVTDRFRNMCIVYFFGMR